MIKNLVIVAFLFVFSITSNAMLIQSHTAVTINEINGKLFQLPYQTWPNISDVKDIESHEIKPNQWHVIIKNEAPGAVIPLLDALSKHLPKEALKPYLIVALKRPLIPNTHHERNIAPIAYSLWKKHFGWQSAYQLRTNPQWRQNLQPDVQWVSLFNYSDNRFSTTSDAVDFLHNNLLLKAQNNIDPELKNESHRMTTYQTNIAINKISQHHDLSDLTLWMHDENFAVALGSWLALHRMAPKQFANEILDKALWWQTQVEYTYGSGCVVHTAQLTPLEAALDLFSDYLSTDTIHQTLVDAPNLWLKEPPKYGRLNDSIWIKNPQTFKALQRFGDKSLEFYSYQQLINQQQLKLMPAESKNAFITNPENRFNSYYWDFNESISTHLINKIKAKPNGFDHSNHYDYIHAAFEAKNDAAKSYINAVFQTMLTQGQYEAIDHILLAGYSIWPRGWNGLKQQIIDELKMHPYESEHSSLALNIVP